MTGGPPISVIVPTRNRPELLARCLKALRTTTDPTDEIIACDSASTDPRVREAAEAGGATYVRIERPGTSLARNVGWAAARHDLIAFVDDDIEVTAGWAEAIRTAFAADPKLGLLTGRVEVPEADAAVDHPTSIETSTQRHELAAGAARPPGISGNCATRRDVLVSVGGFDEGLGPGTRFRAGEDKDLFDRILRAGAKGRYEPGMFVRHVQWRSRAERLRLDWSYGIGSGARLAKILKTDRRHARAVARDTFIRWGLADLATCIRNRYKLGAAAAMLRIAGMITGIVAGLMTPVRAGHFASGGRAS